MTLEQLKEKKAFLFDLDGTLVDSMWMWKSIDIEYLGRFGYSCPEDLQRKVEGMSFTETAVYFKERFRLDRSVEDIKRDWVEMSLEKYRKEVPLKEGAGRLLSWARAQGILMGIATSNGRDMVDAVLDSLNISGYFRQVTTACEVAAGKPAPDIYLKVAKDLGVRPEDCAVFEDVPAGILAGKSAGMTVVAVDDAFSAHLAEEKERLADCRIHSFLDLFGDENCLENKGEPS